jgi:hypothetical protein
VLDEVSCASPDMCLAAGGEQTTGEPATYRAFDGTSWRAVAGATSNDMSVDCAPTACFAASAAGVVQRWDGTSLSDLDPIPVPSDGRVLDLDCPSADWCIAIAGKGFAPDTPVAVTWSPASGWTPLALPPVANLILQPRGVACDAPESCLAAVKTADGTSLVFHRLSGGAWTPVASPAAVTSVQLEDVDCPTADMCVVVGGAIRPTDQGFGRVHAILRDGAWSVDGPSTLYVAGARVDCWSAEGCAVSSQWTSMTVLRGNRWLPLVLPPGTEHAFGVSCPAPRTCEVVGPLVNGDTRSPAARLDLDPG